MYQRADGLKVCTVPQIEALCTQAGMAPSVVARVIEAGRFGSDGVLLDKFLFLLLAMTCDSFAAVTQGIFEIFGRELESARFVDLISYLAPDMDPDVTSQFLAELTSSVQKTPTVTYSTVITLDVLSEKLRS